MRKHLNHPWRAAVVAAACLAIALSVTMNPRASASGIVISQVYGGGGNSGATLRNDFIELFNAGNQPVSLAGWSVQYASSTGTTWQRTNLSATTLEPGQYYLIQQAQGSGGTTSLPAPDATGTIQMSATAGKVALVTNQTTLSGSCPTTGVADFVGFGSATNCAEGPPTPNLSNTTAAIRKVQGCTDSDSNAADFEVGAPNPRNTGSVFAACSVNPPARTDPTGIGLAAPATVPAGTQTRLTVAVTPGANPASTGLSVAANLLPIGGIASQAFVDEGGNVFSFVATVPLTVTPGSKTLSATIADAQGRTAAATIALTVDLPPPTTVAISEIQGPGTESPLAGQRVSTAGIVTGVKDNGFFIQSVPPGDSDPRTSEGVFVYTGTTPPSSAAVGHLVTVVGTVQEYQSLTEIGGAVAVTVVSAGHGIPAAVPLPTPTPAGGTSQLEPYEGMRVAVDSLTVVSPTDFGVFYGIMPGTDRPFREPGLEPWAPVVPDMPAEAPRFDGNPERIGVDGGALGPHVIDVTTHAVVSNITGPLDYASGTYVIDADATPSFTGNVPATPVPAAAPGQFTVASWNMLFFTNHPTRLSKASLVIRDVMNMPDIIGVQEVASLETLQALADRVNQDAGSLAPGYSAFLVPVNTTQNIGFLVKQAVSVAGVTQVGADARFIDPRDGSSDPLHDRPPLVLRATIPDPRGGPAFPITVVLSHLRSLIDADENTPRGLYARTKRRLGAEYLAAMLQQYQTGGEHVVSIGDYNAFQFNDGYVDVVGTMLGAPAPATQVLMASSDLVEPNFTNLIDFASPAERYSYVFAGNAQAIDHVIVSPNLLPRVAGLAFARANADFPYAYATDPARPERASDHDPVVAYFTFPTADLSVTASAAPASPVLSGSTLTYTIVAANGANDDAANVTVTAGLPAGLTGATTAAPEGWTCDTTPTAVTCTAGVFPAQSTAVFTVAGAIDCLLPDSDLLSEVSIDSAMYDPDPSNDSATVVTTVSNPPPVISDAFVSPAVIWPPNHKMVPVRLEYSVADNCGPAPVCSLTVTSNEPADGRGDGNTAADWQVVDAHNLLVRAERSGKGSGRTYTIGITCADASGKPGTKNVFVTVPKSQR